MKVDDPLSLLCALAPQQASTMNIVRVLIIANVPWLSNYVVNSLVLCH